MRNSRIEVNAAAGINSLQNARADHVLSLTANSDVSLHSTSIGVIDSTRQSVNTEMLDLARTNLDKAWSLNTKFNVGFIKTIEQQLAKHPLPQ